MTVLDIQISVEAEGWSSEEDLAAFATRVLDAAVDLLKREEDQPFPKMPVELSLVFTDDDRIERMFRALHRQARDMQILVLSCRQRAFRDLGARSLAFAETD